MVYLLAASQFKLKIPTTIRKPRGLALDVFSRSVENVKIGRTLGLEFIVTGISSSETSACSLTLWNRMCTGSEHSGF